MFPCNVNHSTQAFVLQYPHAELAKARKAGALMMIALSTSQSYTERSSHPAAHSFAPILGTIRMEMLVDRS